MSNKRAESQSSASPVQSVDRALQILELIADAGEAGVTEIGTALGVHKSTAFRLVASLEGRGLVEQTADRGKYRLGVGILRLAAATTARLDVVQEARPFARVLAADTGETINIAVLNNGAALYLDQIAATAAIQSNNWVGQWIPLHATSNGKVLLSGLSEEQIRAEVGVDLTVFTPATVTDVDVLVAEVEEIRGRGYVIVVDELEMGLTAVAAPIRNVHGDVVASLSVSGPTFRFASDKVDAAVERTLLSAADVSRRLGYR
ncbi:IclR family transcriptional regulator [Aeromicrobium sp.]|uniref:IclR family transcriptional regulator n=1 Tax=Aeromicrobium sp. TaxID=1871063 RepID=UPI0019BD568E|nr:IclR family transcriptional regulator [Aeromicrobium sp.]MBC7631177.1 IclR family transcriptional regulator [Aeromicrobium sp.]